MRARPSHWIARGINYLYTCHFKCLKFWSSRLRRPNTSGKIWELLQATQTSGVQSAAAQRIGGQESTAVRLLGTNGPTKRLSLLHPFAVFNCFFWGGPASLTLAMPEFETKCLHVRNVERLPLICWEFDTVSEVEHPGLASWSLVAKKDSCKDFSDQCGRYTCRTSSTKDVAWRYIAAYLQFAQWMLRSRKDVDMLIHFVMLWHTVAFFLSWFIATFPISQPVFGKLQWMRRGLESFGKVLQSFSS